MTDSSVTEAAPVIGADLSDLDTTAAADAGADMEVRHPTTGEVLRHADGRPFLITVFGRDSEKFIQLVRSQGDRRIASQMRSKAPIPMAVLEKDEIELLVSLTMKWDIILSGQSVKSEANEYRRVYTKYRWLKEQVDEFVGNRGNFSKR